MSFYDLIDYRDVGGGPPAYKGSSSLSDILSLSYDSMRMGFNFNSNKVAIGKALDERDEQFRKLTGKNPVDIWSLDPKSYQDPFYAQVAVDREIARLKGTDPETYKDLKFYAQVKEQAQEDAAQSIAEYEEAMQLTPGIGKYFTAFAGGFGATLTDPVQLMSIGAGASLVAAKSLLGFAAKEALITMASEAALQPAIMSWQKDIGRKYGLDEATKQILTAGLFGGAFGAGVYSVSKVAKMDLPELLAKVADSEKLPSNVKAGLSELSDYMKDRGSSPSSNPIAHNENIQSAVKALAQNRPLRPDEIQVKLLDDIDGVPREAFAFINEDLEIQVPVSKVKSETVLTPISKMTKYQLNEAVTEKLLPVFVKELEDDIADNAKLLANVTSQTVGNAIKRLDKQLDELNNQQKIALDKNREALRKAKKISNPKEKSAAIKKAESERPKIVKETNMQKLDINNKKNYQEQLLSMKHLELEKKKVLRDLKNNTLPTETLIGKSISNTISKVVNKAYQANKINNAFRKVNQDELDELLETYGLKEKPTVTPEQLDESLDEVNKILEDDLNYRMMDLDEEDLDIEVFDTDGNPTTLREIQEGDKAVTQALTNCSMGGAA